MDFWHWLESLRDDLPGSILAACIVLIGLVIGGVCIGDALSSRPEPFAPLVISDVTINSRVEGIAGPATRVGQPYNGTLEICNGDDAAQTITFVIQFERLSGPVRFVSLGSVAFPKQPGCETLTGDSAPLPPEVTPGRWRESTAAIVQQGDQKQTVSFVSDAMVVVK